jgi:hypothetical protein
VKTYLFRRRGSDGIDGVVRAENIMDLFQLVDEFDNPHAFEFMRIRREFCIFPALSVDHKNALLADEETRFLCDCATAQRWGMNWVPLASMAGGEEQWAARYSDYIARFTK